MNNAKMWLVVSPNVGVPIFLGAVAVGSFAVHVAVLSNTGWVSDFLSGKDLGSSMESAAVLELPNEDATKASYALDLAPGTTEFSVTLSDGTLATAVIQPFDVTASIDTPLTVPLE